MPAGYFYDHYSLKVNNLEVENIVTRSGTIAVTATVDIQATGRFRILNHTANADYGGMQLLINGGGDNAIFGWSSNTYTTGGGIGWLGNNQAFIYTAGFAMRVGSGISSTFALETGDNEIGVGTAVSTSTYLNTAASTTAKSSIRFPHGSAPTSPVNGDVWTESGGMFVQINGTTKQVAFV